MALAYTLVAETINSVALPGIPLYHPPPGPLLTILGGLVGGAVLGLIAAWPKEGLTGIFLGGGAGALGVSLAAAVPEVERLGLAAPAVVTFYTFLPRLFFYLPHTTTVRWALFRYREAGPPPPFIWSKHGVTTLFVLGLAGLVGSCSLRSENAREALVAMNDLLQESAAAATIEQLPEPLQPIQGFLEGATGGYTLEWSDEVESFQGLRPIPLGEQRQSLVIVRYESGLTFTCVFTPPVFAPRCTR
jgi:hypothetical protein